MNGKKVMNRWLVVFGAVLIQLCLGAIYAWPVFTPALSKAGWTAQNTQLVFSVGLATFAVVMVWAGRRLGDWGPRKLAMLGGVVLGAGYVLAGLFGGTSVQALTILLGLVGGAGIGLGYVVPIAVGMRWFPDHKGMITGLAVAGFGFGAMGWIKLAGKWGGLIANMGLSTTFIIYGVAFAVLVVVGGIWMVYPPAGWKPEGYEEPEANAATGAPESGLAGAEMLGTVQFPMIFITFVFSAGAGLMTIGLMKLYPVQALVSAGYAPGEADALAGTAMAVYFSLANGIGRIAWGMISDRIGRKLSVILMTAVQGVVVASFTHMAGNHVLLFAGAAIIGFNFGGNFALFPTITADVFGSRNVGRNYPYVFLAYGVGGIFGPMLGGRLGDMHNFGLAFLICGMLCLAGSAVTMMVRRPVPVAVRD